MIDLFLKVFGTSFLVFDVALNIFPMLALTSNLSQKEKIRIANRAMIISSSLVFFVMFIGGYALSFFEISQHSLQFVGAALIGYTGLVVVMGREDALKTEDSDIAIFPIACPLLAGPGVFSYVISAMQENSDLSGKMIVFSAVCCSLIFSYFVLVLGVYFGSKLRKDIVKISGLMFGLLLMAFATQMFINAINGAFLQPPIDNVNFTQEEENNNSGESAIMNQKIA